jgi:hypothetical protein
MGNIVDFAEMLRDSINEKIKESRNDMHESHNHIDKDRLLIEIRALEWVLGQIRDLVNKEKNTVRLVIKRVS